MTAPRIIGPYEIVELLGRGGMGEVYKAVDTRMYRRPVALKLLSEAMEADPRALSRFDLEIETAANLRHPNIVQIYDRGEFEGRRYFAMEFLEGGDLTLLVKEHDQRPLDARLEIVLQLSEALDYAHAHGVVHRDIKPANILVISRGGSDHVKLVDFGIAHVARADRTRTVVQPGTLLYMSPEQLKDEPISPRSDLFSLGIVAYELCTGVHPFKAKTEYLASSNIMHERQAPLRALEPSAPEALESLVDQLLEKDPDRRPASAGDVAGELKKILRQMRASSSDSDLPSFGNLDEMTGPMVERIVHWAKSQESSGALLEALEAYKRALLLAPDAPWLHARVERLEEQIQQSSAIQPPPLEDLGKGTSSRNRHREAFVRERMVEADAALDEGELDQASSIAAVILRQFPDESRALELMDRIVLMTDRGLPVKAYRQALRAAREAFGRGDLDAARASRDAAAAIWPDDDELVALGREIENWRLTELDKSLKACDAVLVRASEGRIEDAAAPAEVAEGHEALRRAEALGADAEILVAKREALDRLAAQARSRMDERARREREAEDARRAEARALLDDVGRRLAAVERAMSADLATARAARADVRAASEAIARAGALGVGSAEISTLSDRAQAAARALDDHVAREEARERDVADRLAAIDAGLRDVERLAGGETGEALQAGELLRALESDLATLAAERSAAGRLVEAHSAAARLRAQLDERRRAEEERRARDEKDRREREEQERREREERERREREERQQRDRLERAAKEKAAATAQRLGALLSEARTAFREADDLARSIETEADLMGKPLAAARRAVDEMLRIEPDDADAGALRGRIDKLAKAAEAHAGEAARRREAEERKRRDDEARRLAERTAARKRWMKIAGAAAVGIAVIAGGVAGFSAWRRTREAARIEEMRRSQEREDRAREALRREIAGLLAQAGKDIDAVTAGIGAIRTEGDRAGALARCDAISRSIRDGMGKDPSNADLGRLEQTLNGVRGRIQAVDLAPQGPPTDELAASLAEIRKELKIAGDASRDLPSVQNALRHAERGIATARDLRARHPEDQQAQPLLRELERTQTTLLGWQRELLKTPPPDQAPERQWRTDLASASEAMGRVDALLRIPGPLADPGAAIAECQRARGLVAGVLKQQPGQESALGLTKRISDALAEIDKRKRLPPPTPPPPELPPQDRDAISGLLAAARAESLASETGLRNRIGLFRQALAKLDTAKGDWVAGTRATAQSDLDEALVRKVFLDFVAAVNRRDVAAVRSVYPSYPGGDMLSDARDIHFELKELQIDPSHESASATQSLRVLPGAGAWQKPKDLRFAYTLRRQGSGFVILGQRNQ